MTNHSILGNVLCPACGSDDFELLETEIDGKQNANFHCIDCDEVWRQNASGELASHDPKPLKF